MKSRAHESHAPYFRFGEFQLDRHARRLMRGTTAVALTPKAFDALLCLLDHAGTAVSKDQLMAEIWPGRIVEENNLNQAISTLRRALGEQAGDGRYISTEPNRGYRFVADVETVEAGMKPATAVVTIAADAIPAPGDDAGVAADGRADVGRDRENVRSRLRLQVGFGVALALLALMVIWRIVTFDTAATRPRSATPTTVAVLPFKPIRVEDRDTVLEMGMADTLISKLSRSRQIAVRSLSSVRRFDRLDQDPQAAGLALDVRYVLEGQLQKDSDRVRVSARLLDVGTGVAIWSDTFDEPFSDVFGVQDTIAAKVANAMSLSLDRDERQAMALGYTRSSEAYELYLTGRYHIGKVTPDEIRSGVQFFRKAIAIDPDYALAHAAIAEALRRLPITSDIDPNEAFPEAKIEAQRALAIDADLAEGHSVLGWIAMWYEWDWALAEREFRRAIDLDPSIAEAHLGYAGVLSNTGRDIEAMEEARRARELDPLSPMVNSVAATYAAVARRPDEARQLIGKALQIDPEFWIAHFALGMVATGNKDYPLAIAEFERARDTSGGSLQAVSMLGSAQAQSGNASEARAVLDRLETLASKRYVPATAVATVHAGLGDFEATLTWLERAYAQRDVRMTFLKVDRRWDGLRNQPRFAALMHRMKLD